MAGKEPKAISCPFEVAAGAPTRVSFTDAAGQRLQATLVLGIHDVEDLGPEVEPSKRYNIRFGTHLDIRAR
jgi:hypothetical protein